jgi:outer membrane protein OmpA-like peptidoglycan-associated protein
MRPAALTILPLALVACRASVPAAPSAKTFLPTPELPPRHTDSDGDGIPDEADLCPDEPANRNAADMGDPADGCRRERAQRPYARTQILEKVFFAKDSATIKEEFSPMLAILASTLKSYPEIILVEVLGRASDAERRPRDLAGARADVVLEALLARGVSRSQLLAHDYEPGNPVIPAGQRSEYWLAQDRRAEFLVMKDTQWTLVPALGGFILNPPCTAPQILPQAIEFAFGSAALVPRAASAVDQLAAFLKHHPGIGAARLYAFVAANEPDRVDLAGARAAAVRQALIDRGIPASRLLRRNSLVGKDGPGRTVQVEVVLPNPARDKGAGCPADTDGS